MKLSNWAFGLTPATTMLCQVAFAVCPNPGEGQAPTLECPPSTPTNKTQIVITQSNYTVQNTKVASTQGPCIIVMPGVTNVVIKDSDIGPCRDSTAVDAPYREGIFLAGERGSSEAGRSSAITVRRNIIHDVSSGFYGRGVKNPIIIDRNFFYNVMGPTYRAQLVQFEDIRYGTGRTKVICNVTDGRLPVAAPAVGQPHILDHISLLGALGASASFPIEIAYNRIRGLTHNGAEAGGGITVGDPLVLPLQTTPLDSGFYDIHHNTIVLSNNTGIAVAGGHDIVVADNKIDQRGPDLQSLTGWGITVRKHNTADSCANVSLLRNRMTLSNLWAWVHTGMAVEGPFMGTNGEACTNVQFPTGAVANANITNDVTLSASNPALGSPDTFDQLYANCN